MKILLLLPRPLIPADSGGKIRSLNLFTRLAERMEVHAVSLADPVKDTQGIDAMRSHFASYTPVPWQESAKGSLRFYGELFANSFCDLPYSVAKYRLSQLRRTAERIAEREDVDLFFCDFLPTAAALLESRFKPRVVCEHNVEFVLRKRLWTTEPHPLKKRIFKTEWEKTYRIEKQVCRAFDHVLAVSEADSQIFQTEFAIRHVSSVPTGVDTEFFAPQQVERRSGNLVFVGSMDWYPNEDAVLWFLRQIYPRIRAESSTASLTIVGRNPTARLQAAVASDDTIELTGKVDDVRPYVARAEIVVVPIRVAGGTRIKIPEAMAMAKPIVSTTVGAEGLELVSGREIALADEEDAFARTVLQLLGDGTRQGALGTAAREKALREYSWREAVDKVQQILESVVQRYRAVGGASSDSPALTYANEGGN